MTRIVSIVEKDLVYDFLFVSRSTVHSDAVMIVGKDHGLPRDRDIELPLLPTTRITNAVYREHQSFALSRTSGISDSTLDDDELQREGSGQGLPWGTAEKPRPKLRRARWDTQVRPLRNRGCVFAA